MSKLKISPSIIAGNLSQGAQIINDIYKLGLHNIHLDVMDGSFVDNISFGWQYISNLPKPINMKFDVHLMIEKPQRYIEHFANAGADRIFFHPESCCDKDIDIDLVNSVIRSIKQHGAIAGIAIDRPNQNAIDNTWLQILSNVECVIVMSVRPGFSGQQLITKRLEIVKQLRTYNFTGDIIVDGGVNSSNITMVLKAGATTAVCGNSFFQNNNYQENLKTLLLH